MAGGEGWSGGKGGVLSFFVKTRQTFRLASPLFSLHITVSCQTAPYQQSTRQTRGPRQLPRPWRKRTQGSSRRSAPRAAARTLGAGPSPPRCPASAHWKRNSPRSTTRPALRSRRGGRRRTSRALPRGSGRTHAQARGPTLESRPARGVDGCDTARRRRGGESRRRRLRSRLRL